MPSYYILKEMDSSYPTAKEMAKRLADSYGIVNHRGKPHEQFVRAYLEADLHRKKGDRIMTIERPHCIVYPNSDAILDLAEELLPVLEEKKEVAVPVIDFGTRMEREWRVYWNAALSVHKKYPRPAYSMRVYRPRERKWNLDRAS